MSDQENVVAEELEFPQVYVHEDKKELVAFDEVQGAAFEKAGFKANGGVPKTKKN